MGTSERREAILHLLYRRKHETIENLAHEFGVSYSTIRRDIDVLSLRAPIEMRSGRYNGGVYIVDFNRRKPPVTQEDLISALHTVIRTAEREEKLILGDRDKEALQILMSRLLNRNV
ncbi:transcriptional regulator DeoR family [Clostridium sp. CAG:448]|nr:transcriptional regulator DeoR family [Clostridium sp. CAG:448]